MIAFGGAIGSGLFLGTGSRLHTAGPALAIVYAVAGLFGFLVVRAMGELVMHRPTTGSLVSYSREFIGEKAAYFAGWMHFLGWACGGIGDITAAAIYIRFFFPELPQWVPAAIALAVVVTVNLISVQLFGEIEFWFSAIKITAIVVFMLIGIGVLVSRHQIAGEATGPQLILSHGGLFPGGVLPALMILQGVVFAYAGIELVGVTAGEAKNARDVVPKAVNSIAWRIGVFYIGSVLVLVMLLPWSSYSGNVSPFVTVLDKLGVPGAAGVMNLVVLTAAMSSVNSALYSSSRILRSLAANGSAPKLAGLMGRHGVPYGGVLITAFVYLIGLILNVFVAGEAFEIALNFSALGILGMWGMIMVSHAAMVRKAKRGQLKRPEYRLPLAPFSNYLTIAFLLLVFALSWFDVPAGRTLIYSTPGVLALLVIGWFGVRRRQRKMAAERVANLP
ncbi:MAG TPA: amino acid permease [Pseudonocardiaceae bacterium]